MTKSTVIPLYHSKEKFVKMIEYMKKGRARTEEDANKLFKKEHSSYNQPDATKRKKQFKTPLHYFGQRNPFMSDPSGLTRLFGLTVTNHVPVLISS